MTKLYLPFRVRIGGFFVLLGLNLYSFSSKMCPSIVDVHVNEIKTLCPSIVDVHVN